MDLYLERHVISDDLLQAKPVYEDILPRQFRSMMKLNDLYPQLDVTGAGHQSAQSLDQSYYTALQVDDLRKRDEDQVVLKWFKDKQLASMEKECMRCHSVWQRIHSLTESI